MLIKHKLAVGPFQSNCYLLICDKTSDAAVIDPGDDFERIQSLCKKTSAKVKYAALTHAHVDHVGAVGALKKWNPDIQIALHKEEQWIYQNLPMQGQLFGLQYEVPPPVDHYLKDRETL